MIAEIKYSRQQIPTKIISEMQHKVEAVQKLTKSRIQKALISLEGPSAQLNDAEYFDYSITGRELL